MEDIFRLLPTGTFATKSEERVVLRVDDLRLKERVTTRISSGESASFYRLPSCGCYAVVDEIAFILPKKLVQIQLHFTLITFYNAPENSIAAFRTNIAGFFILNPFFSTNLSPIRNGPQNNLFADKHREIFNILAGKFIALMTSCVTFLSCASPDLTLPARHKLFIR